VKIPAEVKQCTAHRKACPYRERYEKMETALQIIYIWAKVAVASNMDCVSMKDMEDIRNKAHEALHLLDKVRNIDKFNVSK